MNSLQSMPVIASPSGPAFAWLVPTVIALPPIAILSALAIAAQRHDRPLAEQASDWGRRWYVWLLVAAGLLMLGAGVLVTDADGPMTAWTTWALSWIYATEIAAIGLGLGAARLIDHRRG